MLEQTLNMVKTIVPAPIFRFFQPWYHFTLAFVAAVRYGFPSRKLIVVGVTGTKGKSSVTEMVGRIFEADGKKTAIISTIHFSIAGKAPSSSVESSVLSSVGARPADRDSVDTQVILGVRTRTGSVINCVAPDGSPRCSSNAGGWPNYPVNTRPITLPTNPDADDNADGYTNLENWLQDQAALVE